MTKSAIITALVSALFVSALQAIGPVAKDEAPVLDEQEVPFVYEAKAEIPTPVEKLASIISSDYRSASDEFQQHDMLTKLTPVIQKRIDAARSTKQFVIRINYSLPPYDFNQHGFSTGLKESTFIPYNNQYAVKFINWDQIGFVPVPEASARTLSGSLRNNRSGILRVYCNIDSAKEENINGWMDKTVYAKVTRVVLSLMDGRLVGEKEVDTQSQAL